MSCATFNSSVSFVFSGGCTTVEFGSIWPPRQYFFLFLPVATSTVLVALLILGHIWIVVPKMVWSHAARGKSLAVESDTFSSRQPTVDAPAIAQHGGNPDDETNDGFEVIHPLAGDPPSGPGNAVEDPPHSTCTKSNAHAPGRVGTLNRSTATHHLIGAPPPFSHPPRSICTHTLDLQQVRITKRQIETKGQIAMP